MKRLLRIWEYDRWLIKLILLVSFIVITGFPQVLVRHITKEQKSLPSVAECGVQTRELAIFMMEKVDAAETKISKGIPYSPYDYFEDLWQFHLKCQELKIQRGGSMIEINRLGWLMQCGITEKKFAASDLEKAKAKYKELIDPGRIPREELVKSAKAFGLKNILVWLLLLYLKTLPLVFMLYLVWAKDEAGYKKFRMPKPLNFFTQLILYPFVVGLLICRALREAERETLAEAELRRTRKLFAYVTEEEQEKIRQFAKSNLSLAEWRSSLSEMGLKPRHSFEAAIAVTILFAFVIRPLEAGAKEEKSFSWQGTVLCQIEKTKNLARSNICEDNKEIQQDQGNDFDGVGDQGDIAVSFQRFDVSPAIFPCVMLKMFFPLSEFFRKIFHVPLQVVQIEAIFETQPQS